MATSAKGRIKNITTADMRDHMYGEIQSLIEGNPPKNVVFHYFMPIIPFGPELAAFMDIGPKAQEWKDKKFNNNDLMRAAINFAAIVDYVPEISNDKTGNVVDMNTLIASGQKVSSVYESILFNCRVFNNSRSEQDQEKLEKLRALLYKKPEERKVEKVEEGLSAEDELSALLTELDDENFNTDDGFYDTFFSEGESAKSQSFIADPDSISEPTMITKLYDALALNYDTVYLNALDQLKAISPRDPNAGLRKKILINRVNAAKQRWEAQGKKRLVESIKARIQQMSQGGMPEYLSELKNRFEGSEMLASVFTDEEEFGIGLLSETAHYTALRPNGILSANGLMKIKIKSDEMDSESKFKYTSTSGSVGLKLPFKIGSIGGSGSKATTTKEDEFYNKEFEISFELVQGLIDRPWFEKAFIESRAYTTVDPRTKQPLDAVAQITKLSDGKIPPKEGLLKAIPMTIYFIKNLKIRSKAFAKLSASEIDDLSAKAGLSIFGFGTDVKHENKTTKTRHSTAETMGEISSDGIYIVAMSSVYLKDSPNPDFDSFPAEQWI